MLTTEFNLINNGSMLRPEITPIEGTGVLNSMSWRSKNMLYFSETISIFFNNLIFNKSVSIRLNHGLNYKIWSFGPVMLLQITVDVINIAVYLFNELIFIQVQDIWLKTFEKLREK